MLRVFVLLEGPTEASFVETALAPYFWPSNVHLTAPIIGALVTRVGAATTLAQRRTS